MFLQVAELANQLTSVKIRCDYVKIVGKFFSKALYITAYVPMARLLYMACMVGTWIFDKEAPLESFGCIYGSEVPVKGSSIRIVRT